MIPRDAVRLCAELGLTASQAAGVLCLDEAAARTAARVHGFRFSKDDRAEAWRRCAAAGMSAADAAESLGYARSSGVKLARYYGVEFPAAKYRKGDFRNRLSPQERRQYVKIRGSGIARDDALRAVGRGDLVEAARA